jgi:hypothetical protein
MMCFVIPAMPAIPARFVGAYIGAFLGAVARHAIAWFMMWAVSAMAYLCLYYNYNSANFAEDLRQGVAISAIAIGVYIATPLEAIIAVLECIPRNARDRHVAP